VAQQSSILTFTFTDYQDAIDEGIANSQSSESQTVGATTQGFGEVDVTSGSTSF
jgi:hypothetical protein